VVEKAWKLREVRFKTQQWFAQKKFNLFREESEGFAKLLTELAEFFFGGSAAVSADKMVKRLQSLIGYFDLDPNRVVDVVLDSVDMDTASEVVRGRFLQVISIFNKDTVAHILGFKFNSLKQDTPPSLYRVAAYLIQQGLVQFEAIYGRLSPPDEEMAQARADVVLEARKNAANVNMVSLKKADDEGDKKEDKASKPAETAAAPTTEQPTPPKLELLRALLDMGAWEQAERMLNHLHVIQPAAHPAIADALCGLLHRKLEPAYAPIAARHRMFAQDKTATATPAALSAEEYTALPATLVTQLRFLGCHLKRDVVLFTKLCRVLTHTLKLPVGGAEAEQGSVTTITPEMETILADVLVPAYSLIPSNVAVANDLWSVLSCLDYATRYRLYGYWQDTLYQSIPELAEMKAKTIHETKYFRKRLSGSRVKECGRALVKFTLSNPLPVFDLILEQLKVFDNLIVPMVDSLKYMPKLIFDMLSYVLLLALTDTTQSKLKDDGVNESHWFQSVSSFLGNFHRKYCDVDLTGIVQCIVNQLKDERSLDLLILRELLANMGKCVCELVCVCVCVCICVSVSVSVCVLYACVFECVQV
jgi:THO complex subunit 2